jgi:hypothetical protein
MPHEGNGIEGETQEGKKGEGAYQGDGHRQRRDEGGSPALEEDKDHEDDEDEGFKQGVDDLFQPLPQPIFGKAKTYRANSSAETSNRRNTLLKSPRGLALTESSICQCLL